MAINNVFNRKCLKNRLKCYFRNSLFNKTVFKRSVTLKLVGMAITSFYHLRETRLKFGGKKWQYKSHGLSRIENIHLWFLI